MSDEPFAQGEAEEGSGEAIGPWVITFADMVSLLMAFFIMLVSISTIEVKKFEAVVESLRKGFGVGTAVISIGEGSGGEPTVFEEPATEAMVSIMEVDDRAEKLKEELEKLVEEQDMGEVVSFEETARGVILRVEGEALFGSGEAVVKAEARPLLDQIADVMKKVPYKVSIEGHTDDIPIRTARFPSNWELSAGRALAALRYLVDEQGIDRKRFNVTGYADTQPLIPNINDRARQANRRIEFVYIMEEGR